MKSLVGLVALWSILALPSLAAAQDSHAFLWTASEGMQDLGVVPGWVDSAGYAINRSGAVVGCNGKDMVEAAFGSSADGNMRLLNGLSQTNSCAEGVNGSGQVVGDSLTKGGGGFHAFLWTRDGGAQDLGTLGGPQSLATGINASGEVVGSSEIPSGVVHAFLWTQSAGMQDLTTLSGKRCPACQSQAFAINNNGIIVGQVASNQNLRGYPFIWRNGILRTLGDLGGVGNKGGGAAMGVNKLGQVVGWALTATGDTHAFLWTRADGMQDLGNLPNAQGCFASAINDSTQVVGYCQLTDQTNRAFIWTASAGMQDIGTLGGTSALAWAINNSGQVTGVADTE